MGLGNIFISVCLTYYTLYLIDVIFSKKKRQGIQHINTKLDKLRTVSIKSLDEQKEFINLRYPKRRKQKWSWKGVLKSIPHFIWRIFLFIVCIRSYLYIIDYFNLEIKIYQGVLFIIIFPMLLNLTLRKFGLQKGDLSVIIKGGGKKNEKNNI